jgi:hypothetical protein
MEATNREENEMNRFDSEALDSHITGNYGEDQFPTPRKHTKFVFCDRHAWIGAEGRKRAAEFFAEGGPVDSMARCEGGLCRMWAGTDLFVAEVCHGEYDPAECGWDRFGPSTLQIQDKAALRKWAR